MLPVMLGIGTNMMFNLPVVALLLIGDVSFCTRYLMISKCLAEHMAALISKLRCIYCDVRRDTRNVDVVAGRVSSLLSLAESRTDNIRTPARAISNYSVNSIIVQTAMETGNGWRIGSRSSPRLLFVIRSNLLPLTRFEVKNVNDDRPNCK